jgi:hypothetical protein
MKHLGAVAGIVLIVGLILLTDCGKAKRAGGSAGGGGNTAPMSIIVTDTPPSGLDVLSFQITITGATLQPGNVSLITASQTLELTQLQTDHALLTTANVPVGTYTSMVLTFANPSMTVFNTGTPIASTPVCKTNAFCTIQPKLNAVSVTISTTPFPLPATLNTPVGLLLDLNVNNLVQNTGAAVDPTATGAVRVTTLASVQATTELDRLNDVVGKLTTVGTNQFVLTTSNGNALTVNTDTTTKFFFPTKVCAANNFTCLIAGQILSAQVSLHGDGSLHAVAVNFEDSAGAQEIEGEIVSFPAGAASGTTEFNVVVHQAVPSNATMPVGGTAFVTIEDSTTLTTFLIDNGGFTLPGGVSFASATDLVIGQEVLVRVGSSSSGLAISSSRLILRPAQITAAIFLVDTGNARFTVNTLPSLFSSATPSTITQIMVQTTSQTVFINPTVNQPGLTGLAAGQPVSTGGFLFNTPSGTAPVTQAAQTVRVLPLTP